VINIQLTNKDVQEYIINNLHSDLSELRLKKSPFTGLSSLELIQQIQGKKIAQKKIPFLYENNQIIYPPHINLEQSSSQNTAIFKKSIIKGKTGVDLTGGSGIDSFFLSENTENFYFVEPNHELIEIVKHNFSILGKKNVKFINKTAEDFISDNTSLFDFIYIDPSRRDENKNKKIELKDLLPNILNLLSKFFKFSASIFIKLSPILDLQRAIEQLPILKIYIISVKNETKELLMQLAPESKINPSNPYVLCVNLLSTQPDFCFYWQEEKKSPSPTYSNPKSYLYLPNSSLLKSGAFKQICYKFKIDKLHSNSHIYTSVKKLEDFPGRTFLIIEKNFNPKKSIQKKFNIISRNYPLKPEEIKKKYQLMDGGNKYLIFTRSLQGNHCILAESI
jgi:hypothetical protein